MGFDACRECMVVGVDAPERRKILGADRDANRLEPGEAVAFADPTVLRAARFALETAARSGYI